MTWERIIFDAAVGCTLHEYEYLLAHDAISCVGKRSGEFCSIDGIAGAE